MAENINNPVKGLDALVAPESVTMGQVALIEKIGSPLLTDRPANLISLAESVYLLSLPFSEAVDQVYSHVSEKFAYLWLDKIGPHEFTEKLEASCKALCKFYALLPKAPPDEKKSPIPETGR